MRKVELLSPAGDLERLKVTLLYGADAVYIGGQEYSLRANATNFSIEEIKEGCSFAHKLGKKVYLTLNIVMHNEDLEGLEEYIKEVVDAGIDAFIVSDPCIISHIVDNYPQVEAHLSTQDSTCNYLSCKFYEKLGIDRVVLAREVTFDNTKEIIKNTNIDIETFIHGAMCTCISGRCALSLYLTGRDANKGACAQVCRFDFENENLPYFTMKTKDLNMANHITELIDIGVTSLKVEGRMRSIYYLATVIGTYRKIIDEYYKYNKVVNEDKYNKILDRVANRETTSQFYKGYSNYKDQYYSDSHELSNQDYLGLVLGYNKKDKRLIIQTKNYFEVGEKVNIFTPSGKDYFFKIEDIYAEGSKINKSTHPQNIVEISFNKKIEEFSMIRREV